ncbi:hypothetical protein ACN9M0_35375 [Streptomyces sp. R-07]|uniref:hypothetical protein n=1 Tax=Streptomyces sp. R-07 TaxID=3404052 RepID=UPI003CED77B9
MNSFSGLVGHLAGVQIDWGALDRDENGRDLFITARVTQCWGVRPSGRGKSLWAERTVPHRVTQL